MMFRKPKKKEDNTDKSYGLIKEGTVEPSEIMSKYSDDKYMTGLEIDYNLVISKIEENVEKRNTILKRTDLPEVVKQDELSSISTSSISEGTDNGYFNYSINDNGTPSYLTFCPREGGNNLKSPLITEDNYNFLLDECKVLGFELDFDSEESVAYRPKFGFSKNGKVQIQVERGSDLDIKMMPSMDNFEMVKRVVDLARKKSGR